LAIIEAGFIGIKKLMAFVIDDKNHRLHVVQQIMKELGFGAVVEEGSKENRLVPEKTEEAEKARIQTKPNTL
jgi:hypothetical protein